MVNQSRLTMWIRVVSLAILSTSAACASMHARYQAELDVTEGGKTREAEFVYERTIDTSGHMIACIFTSFIYGGWCWYYTMMPDGSQRAELYAHALRALKTRLKGRKYEITREWTNKAYWGAGPLRQKLDFMSDTDHEVTSDDESNTSDESNVEDQSNADNRQ